ncbi:MAG: hypothetical protein HYZ93_00055 [Candidatus Omnitrophica bacterium]|nr:hypothetical protein [Candidatus Omnitrophota bacterium]
MGARRWLILWGLFTLICLGLGYPTLNRYDPRTASGLTDTRRYYLLATGESSAPTDFPKTRFLVPWIAKPVYWISKGRVGTWDPGWLGLLAANAFFCAGTALLLTHVGRSITGEGAVALLAALLYLLNFTVANGQLSGLVDSAEAFFMMLLVWTLRSRRWRALPFLGLLGALAKETFVPLSLVFASTWWLATPSRKGSGRIPLAWIAGMGVSGVATWAAAQSVLMGELIWPKDLILESSLEGFWAGISSSIFDRSFWYVFIWLLPLGVWRLSRLPRPWVLASGATALAALLGVACLRIGLGSLGRMAFHCAGPLLSLSAALFLASGMRKPSV